jgi:uncharacterized membrane-anchored protein
MIIEGRIKTGKRTKDLIKYLDKKDIALLSHDDIDELAAVSIIDTGVKVVINTGESMTGRYESKGAALLLSNGVKLFDISLPFKMFNDGDHIILKDTGDIIINNHHYYTNVCRIVNEDYVNKQMERSRINKSIELKAFIENTLMYAQNEKDMIVLNCRYPRINTDLENKHVLVVVRGAGCENDLAALSNYISYYKPVIIGVDGGADILLNNGYTPDILIGDMDSVSDIGIYKSKEIILHAYADGTCPCIERIDKMNVKYKILPMPGTSEDVALLLAYDLGAEQMVLLGGHTSMHDFLEKGRNGMGSTLLTRIKISHKLIDFRGFSRLMIPLYSNLININNNLVAEEFCKDNQAAYKERETLCVKM